MYNLCETWGFHGDKYQGCILWDVAVSSLVVVYHVQTFGKNLLNLS
jgi:hypothetical protein